jgi:tRNA 2-thiouridine synthesizing protein E
MHYTLNNHTIPADDNGYLLDHTMWSEALVEIIAAEEKIKMTDAHWQIVRFVRAFYEEYDTSPAIRALVKALQQEFGPEIGNSRHLQRLLPQGPAKMASKLAGLPKPAKCL